jgi:hypothetical protein
MTYPTKKLGEVFGVQYGKGMTKDGCSPSSARRLIFNSQT